MVTRTSLAALFLGMTLLPGCGGPQAPAAVQVPPPPMPEPRKLGFTFATSARTGAHVSSANVQVSDPTAAAAPAENVPLEEAPAGKEKIELSGPLADGKKLDWEESYRGKVVIIIEWASWCQYCRSAMDTMDSILNKYAGQEVAIVGVNIDVEAKAGLDFIEQRKPDFENIIDGKQRMAMSLKYPVKHVPTYLIVNKAGRRVDLELTDPAVWGKIDAMVRESYDPNNPDADAADVAAEPVEEAPVDVFAEEEKKAEQPTGKPLIDRVRNANGEEFLDLHGPTYNGPLFDWASYRGRAVVVVFWASWCPHCKELLSKMENVRRVAHSYNVDVVGVNVDQTPEQAISFLEVAQFPFENILDGQQDMQLDREYPTTTLPVMMVVNKAGKLVQFDFAAHNAEKKLIDLCKEPYAGPLPKRTSSATSAATSASSPAATSASSPAATSASSPAATSSSPALTAPKPSKKADTDETPDDGTLVEAKAGVGKKGRGYGGGIYTEPLKARWTTEQKLIFDVQIPKAMSLFEATQERLPESHEEFMKDIIEENGIQLPELPTGQEYVYLPETGKLMVRQPETK